MNVIISNFPYGQVIAQASAADLEAVTRVFTSAKPVSNEYIGGDYGYVYFAEEQKRISSLRLEVLTERILTKETVEKLKAQVEAEKDIEEQS